MRLSWRPSSASWPPAAVSLNFPGSSLWPEVGGGGGPWVAFLALEGEVASPGGERMVGVGENISGKKKDKFVSVLVFICL